MKDGTSKSLLYDELYNFIKKATSLEINENTILFKDLRQNDNDADLFLLKFSETFHIDMTDFRFDKYFVDEYIIPFQYLFDWWFRKDKIRRLIFHRQSL